MKYVVERVAGLARAEAIAVLEVVPSPNPEPAFRLLAAWGGISEACVTDGFAALFESPGANSLDSRQSARLGFDADVFLCLAAPVRIPADAPLLRGGIILVARHTVSDRAGDAIGLLAGWMADEFEGAREIDCAKALSARHVQAWEQERLTLVTRIHDDLSQNLTFIRLALKSLELQVSAGKFGRVAAEVAELVDIARQVAVTVQQLSTGLRPAMIDMLGPVGAIRLEGQLLQESSGVQVHCDLEEHRLTGQVSIAVFRILELALSNIARHARATRVAIRLHRRSNPDGIEDMLEVEDNGVGFDLAAPIAPLGLMSMNERAEIAGGRLRIVSSSGNGTRIVASFPALNSTGAENGR
jgi:signal transduction histidine kinase